MDPTRRKLLSAMCAGTATLLAERFIISQTRTPSSESASAPGLLQLLLLARSPGTLQISIAPANNSFGPEELGVLRTSNETTLCSTEHPARSIPWGRFRIEIESSPLVLTVTESGKVRQRILFELDSTNVRFRLDGPVFGLGEGGHPLDRRRTSDAMSNGEDNPDLQTYGARLPIPWIISPTGWGLFIGQPQGTFRFTDLEGTYFGVEATSTRNVFLLLGDNASAVLQEYAQLTGKPHLPPKWSFGYQQSHRTLANETEVLSIAQGFRERKLPCDALIYLGTGFCPSGWNTGHGSFTFNDKAFPHPSALLQSLHDLHFKAILHVVPPGNLHGTLEDASTDAAQPGHAIPYWRQHLPLLEVGTDGWWPDEGDKLSVYARAQRNQLYWDGMISAAPQKRPFALHRNGYAGLQRFGWLWSGDTLSTWEALKAQIQVGINIGLCGIPYWGSDTGGFVPTPEFEPELFIRWFQFSAFCPSFRSHGRAWKLHLPWGWSTGDSGPKEVEGEWTRAWPAQEDLHRAVVESICRSFLELRYKLLPYTYSMAAAAHERGIPMIRSLCLGFPYDKAAACVDDAYMWGDSLLIAPVYQANVSERQVYLPAGTWIDFWSRRVFKGGNTVMAPATLETMPIFVRSGAILLSDEVRQYAEESAKLPTLVEIYPGANGNLTWYDDDGTSFAYERGEFMRVQCAWHDAERRLTLVRDTAGLLGKNRMVRVRLAGESEYRTLTLQETVTTVQL